MNIKLSSLNNGLRKILIAYLFTLTIGVIIGIIFIKQTTHLSPEGAVERFNGSQVESELEVPENYAKSISEMLMTTHNHVISFSFIFGSLAVIFYFNTVIIGFWKKFLTIEPFFSIILTFGSIWGMRYLHPDFVYLTIASSTILYASFFVMASVSFYELLFKKN
jgi:hypothetical protein